MAINIVDPQQPGRRHAAIEPLPGLRRRHQRAMYQLYGVQDRLP